MSPALKAVTLPLDHPESGLSQTSDMPMAVPSLCMFMHMWRQTPVHTQTQTHTHKTNPFTPHPPSPPVPHTHPHTHRCTQIHTHKNTPPPPPVPHTHPFTYKPCPSTHPPIHSSPLSMPPPPPTPPPPPLPTFPQLITYS